MQIITPMNATAVPTASEVVAPLRTPCRMPRAIAAMVRPRQNSLWSFTRLMSFATKVFIFLHISLLAFTTRKYVFYRLKQSLGHIRKNYLILD